MSALPSSLMSDSSDSTIASSILETQLYVALNINSLIHEEDYLRKKQIESEMLKYFMPMAIEAFITTPPQASASAVETPRVAIWVTLALNPNTFGVAITLLTHWAEDPENLNKLINSQILFPFTTVITQQDHPLPILSLLMRDEHNPAHLTLLLRLLHTTWIRAAQATIPVSHDSGAAAQPSEPVCSYSEIMLRNLAQAFCLPVAHSAESNSYPEGSASHRFFNTYLHRFFSHLPQISGEQQDLQTALEAVMPLFLNLNFFNHPQVRACIQFVNENGEPEIFSYFSFFGSSELGLAFIENFIPSSRESEVHPQQFDFDILQIIFAMALFKDLNLFFNLYAGDRKTTYSSLLTRVLNMGPIAIQTVRENLCTAVSSEPLSIWQFFPFFHSEQGHRVLRQLLSPLATDEENFSWLLMNPVGEVLSSFSPEEMTALNIPQLKRSLTLQAAQPHKEALQRAFTLLNAANAADKRATLIAIRYSFLALTTKLYSHTAFLQEDHSGDHPLFTMLNTQQDLIPALCAYLAQLDNSVDLDYCITFFFSLAGRPVCDLLLSHDQANWVLNLTPDSPAYSLKQAILSNWEDSATWWPQSSQHLVAYHAEAKKELKRQISAQDVDWSSPVLQENMANHCALYCSTHIRDLLESTEDSPSIFALAIQTKAGFERFMHILFTLPSQAQPMEQQITHSRVIFSMTRDRRIETALPVFYYFLMQYPDTLVTPHSLKLLLAILASHFEQTKDSEEETAQLKQDLAKILWTEYPVLDHPTEAPLQPLVLAFFRQIFVQEVKGSASANHSMDREVVVRLHALEPLMFDETFLARAKAYCTPLTAQRSLDFIYALSLSPIGHRVLEKLLTLESEESPSLLPQITPEILVYTPAWSPSSPPPSNQTLSLLHLWYLTHLEDCDRTHTPLLPNLAAHHPPLNYLLATLNPMANTSLRVLFNSFVLSDQGEGTLRYLVLHHGAELVFNEKGLATCHQGIKNHLLKLTWCTISEWFREACDCARPSPELLTQFTAYLMWVRGETSALRAPMTCRNMEKALKDPAEFLFPLKLTGVTQGQEFSVRKDFLSSNAPEATHDSESGAGDSDEDWTEVPPAILEKEREIIAADLITSTPWLHAFQHGFSRPLRTAKDVREEMEEEEWNL